VPSLTGVRRGRRAALVDCHDGHAGRRDPSGGPQWHGPRQAFVAVSVVATQDARNRSSKARWSRINDGVFAPGARVVCLHGADLSVGQVAERA
jgi:hypothetical protein